MRQKKSTRTWTPEQRLVTVLDELSNASTHMNWLIREAPQMEQSVLKALKLVEQAEQVLGRDATRDLSLPSYRSAGLVEDLDAFVEAYPYHLYLELLTDITSVRIGRGAYEIPEQRAKEMVKLGLARFDEVKITFHGTKEYLRGIDNPTGVPYIKYLGEMVDEISVGIGLKSSQIPERIAAEMVELGLAEFTDVAITPKGRREFLKGAEAYKAL